MFVIIGISLIGWQIKEKAFTGVNRETILILDLLYFIEAFVILLNAYTNLR